MEVFVKTWIVERDSIASVLRVSRERLAMPSNKKRS
jgi:hypothetical protein